MSAPPCTVLLTRSREENEAMAGIFTERGLNVVSVPGIEISDPTDWARVDEAIESIAQYDGVLFTSRNSVEKFLGRLSLLRSGVDALQSMTIAAVGERTASALDNHGVSISIVPDAASADDLASAIPPSMTEGKRFLFPRSDIARDVLPQALRRGGATVDEVTVYRTVSPPSRDLDGIRSRLADGTIRVASFFSPSAVRTIVQFLGTKCLSNTMIAVIGPTTGAAARQFGLNPVIQAGSHSAEDLAEAILEHIRRAS